MKYGYARVSTEDQNPAMQCFLPAMVITTSSRCHLSPRRGARRRMRLANSRPNFRPHCRIVSYVTEMPRAASISSTMSQMRVGVILTGTVVPVGLWRGIERRELFQPSLVVLVQPRFVVVYENRRGDVHGVAQQQTLLHAAPGHTVRQPGGDVHKSHPGRHVEGKVFRERLHACAPA